MKPIYNLLVAAMLALSSLNAFADKININEADAEALTGLNGIGQARAEAIIEYRDAHGPFQSIDALTDVRGIGLGVVDRNRDRITIDAMAVDQKRIAAD